LVFYSSVITMMHGPTNIKFVTGIHSLCIRLLVAFVIVVEYDGRLSTCEVI